MGASAKKLAHRMAFIYMLGYAPDCIDHINGDKTDNSWINLRAVTPIQNGRNRKLHKNSKSGMDGVQWYKSRKSWTVYVCGVYGGQFKNIDEAKEKAYELRRKAGFYLDTHS